MTATEKNACAKEEIYYPDSCTPLASAWHNGQVEMHVLARGTYPGYPLKKDELKGIKSIGYWNSEKMQNWGLDWHRNEGIELCLLETGNLCFELNDRQYTLTPNTLTITRPWILHKLGDPTIGLCKLHWFIIDLGVRQPHQEWIWPDWVILSKDDLNELTRILRLNEQPVWHANDELKRCFAQIGKMTKNYEREHFDSRIKVFINEILILLLEMLQKDKPILNDALIDSKRSVSLFLRSMEDDLANTWTVSTMARHCGLGVTQFSKHCYQLTNCTPINYLNKLRLRKAKKLIAENPDSTITSIAFDCGFSSNQYFTKVYKAHFKETPQSFRENQKKMGLFF
ncbi:helix-turn-helix transcriptional regulator [Sunxiuqinia sp. sy24]|uniref:helix-turn-helix transcriptional regulator n=1 Tax=Sunxiuqinia sp. sy24 TaxID=3461495 RepID=UPI004045A6D0